MKRVKPLVTASLKLRRLGIDTYKEAVVYVCGTSDACLSEGFKAPARIKISLNSRWIIATLNIINSSILQESEAGLSEYAWHLLKAQEGDEVILSHSRPVNSLSFVRSKIFNNKLTFPQLNEIIRDVYAGYYSDIQTSAFLTACACGKLDEEEITALTKSMIQIGENIHWPAPLVADKHCVGGLPGNRTSLIIVPIIAEYGLLIPKTSSRAITSPAGTADTMEVLAPVNLTLSAMRKVVEKENGCIVWGGAVSLSPADDILIRVERALDLDSEGQMIASVLSKKFAAGSTNILIDMPVGPNAKIRNNKVANHLKGVFHRVGNKLGLKVKTVITDGSQPVGRGIGPALEAQDVISVLQNKSGAPADLRARALLLAGEMLEFSTKIKKGTGIKIATEILDSGRAWKKFQAICEAQGGMSDIPKANFCHTIEAKRSGNITAIDNRLIARLAKLTGAPTTKASGIEMHIKLGDKVCKGQPLYTIYAEVKGALDYAVTSLSNQDTIIHIGSDR